MNANEVMEISLYYSAFLFIIFLIIRSASVGQVLCRLHHDDGTERGNSVRYMSLLGMYHKKLNVRPCIYSYDGLVQSLD